MTSEQIASAAGVFRSEPAVLAAWFFGSAAQGRSTPFSDLDFAVLLAADAPHGLDRFTLLDRLARGVASALSVSEDKIDVAALNEQGTVFQYQVIRTGQLICEANRKARELFVWGVLCRYLDFRPTLDIYDRARFGPRRSLVAARIYDANRKMNIEDVRGKLDVLADNERQLNWLAQLPDAEFARDARNLDSALHRLQTSIQALLDIGAYVVGSLKLPTPQHSADIITNLRDGGLIEPIAAENYIRMTAFRNRVVHLYNRIDPAIVLDILQNHLQELHQFRQTLLEIIVRNPDPPGAG